MTTIRATIERLKALYERATLGEWGTLNDVHKDSYGPWCESMVLSNKDAGPEIAKVYDHRGCFPRDAEGWDKQKSTALFIAEAHNALPKMLDYIEKLEKVAEAARRGVSFTIFKEPVVMHPQQLVELLTLAIRDTESALDDLDALDSEAFDRRNFTYSNTGK